MKKYNILDWLVIILVVVGGLNWGLYGAFNKLDLVSTILGDYTILARIVYVLVGLAAIYFLFGAFTERKKDEPQQQN